MIVRSCNFVDIYRVAEIEKECFKKGEAWSYRMLTSAFEDSSQLILVAEENEEVVAHACLQLTDVCEVCKIAVMQNMRGKGIAKLLMSRAEEAALKEGIDRMLLDVRVSNAPAMSLYLKLGYVGYSSTKKMYPDGEDALNMQKIIKR